MIKVFIFWTSLRRRYLQRGSLPFLRVIRDLAKGGNAQFIIATHSPILLGYPGAQIYNFDASPIEQIEYEETEHYQITMGFLNRRERYLDELFREDEEE